VSDQRVQRLATVLVHHSTAVAEGDVVAIEGESAAEPLLLAIYEEVLRAGGHPVVAMAPQGAELAFYSLAGAAQLDFVSPLEEVLTERADVSIRVQARTSPRELSQTPPEYQVRRQRALEALRARVVERAAAGELRWVECQFPTAGYAAEAEMTLAAYEEFFYGACMCDRRDPLAALREQGAETRRLAEWIGGREEVVINGPGTDLRLSIAGRRFVAAAGKHNMPTGEFFTGPVEDSAEGEISFRLPTNFGGHEVAGVRLRFERGAVVDASAEAGEALLHETLGIDAGARRLGELGVGTNFQITRPSRSILFDEKMGGTIHLALGHSYPVTGGVNASAIHWDLVCDLREGGRVTVDGEELLRDGRFMV
jgi:aminopeptidase